MTQELNKEGLEAAIEMGKKYRHDNFPLDYIILKSILAYLNTAKVTGFEERIEELKLPIENWKKWQYWQPEYKIAHLVLEMQAALAGGNTK